MIPKQIWTDELVIEAFEPARMVGSTTLEFRAEEADDLLVPKVVVAVFAHDVFDACHYVVHDLRVH